MAKPKRFSGNAVTKKVLEDLGYITANVEQTIRYPKKGGKTDPRTGRPLEWEMFKRDLWGIADVIACKRNEPGVIFVQHTTAQNVEAHIQKIAGIVEARILIEAKNRIHVFGWKKRGGNGKPVSYSLTITEVGFDEDGLLTAKVIMQDNMSPTKESQADMFEEEKAEVF